MPRSHRNRLIVTLGTRHHLTAVLLALVSLAGARGIQAQTLACTDCHRPGGAPMPHNAGCTDMACLAGCHTEIDLAKIAHLGGPGTPLTGDWTSTCNTCHNRPFPGVYHPYRINVLPGSQTPPGVLDLDDACGQCHGGGLGQLPPPNHATTGSIDSGSTVLTVADGTGFLQAQRVKVSGAGAAGADLTTTIATVAGTVITLAGTAGTTVFNATVVQNPTSNGAPYYTKAWVAPVAEVMHELAGVTYPVTFTIQVPYNTLDIRVDAVVSCGGTCPPLTYDWDWNDGSTHGSGITATHSYATAGTKSIDVVVRTAGLITGIATRSVFVPSPDLPPVPVGTCTFDPNTWTVIVQDASVDDGPDDDMLTGDGDASLRIGYDWGDGTLRTYVARGGSASHTYTNAGSPSVTQIAIDSTMKQVSRSCASGTLSPFTIAGTVVKRDGVTPLASATVQLRKTGFARNVLTAANGTFSATLLKPGTYTLTVTKYGYTFANPAATIAVGPTSTGNLLQATGP